MTDLADKITQVKKGLVKPQLIAKELRTLEAMEDQDGRVFAEFAKQRRENPPVVEIAESKAAAYGFGQAK